MAVRVLAERPGHFHSHAPRGVAGRLDHRLLRPRPGKCRDGGGADFLGLVREQLLQDGLGVRAPIPVLADAERLYQAMVSPAPTRAAMNRNASPAWTGSTVRSGYRRASTRKSAT